MLSLFLFVPLAFLVLLNLLPKGLREGLAFGIGAVLSAAQIFLAVSHPAWFWGAADFLSPFFTLKFQVDELSLILLISIGIVMFSTIFVARYILENMAMRFNFISLMLIALVGMNAIVMAVDIFTLYVFIELTTISLFILITIQKGKPALQGAFKYIVLSTVATALMLSAIALIVMLTGDTSFDVVSGALKVSEGSLFIKIALGLFICGLFIKSGAVPFHGWLPDAYSAAPAPTSVLLAGIVTKTTGVYVLMRLVISVFGFNAYLQDILMLFVAISIVVGALLALRQKDFKRMLSYSSISQVGYIILALGCGTKLAIAGAAFHLLNHAIFKSLLFTNSAAIEKRLGTVDMDQMMGLASRMPVTRTTSMIGFLSTAGIPPLAGFWSKFIIVIALWGAGNFAYAVIALLSSLLTLAYFLVLQRNVFFCKTAEGDIGKASFWISAPEIILALLTVGIGLVYPLVLNNLILTVGNILR